MAVREDGTLIPGAPAYFLVCHKYEEFVSVYDIKGKHLIETSESYLTPCDNMWTVAVKLEKNFNFDNYKIHVTLKRFPGPDHPCRPVRCGPTKSYKPAEGIGLIWFYNCKWKRCPVPYRIDCKLTAPDEKTETFAVHEHFRCLLEKGKDMLVIRAQLYVTGCCDRERMYKSDGGKYSDEIKRYDRDTAVNGVVQRTFGTQRGYI